MKKIPTIFIRDLSRQPALVTPEWHSECGWVRDGEGRATLKHDGASCLMRSGMAHPDWSLLDDAPTNSGAMAMTIPDERMKSLNDAFDLLLRIVDRDLRNRLPREIEDRARSILRHYPGRAEIELMVERYYATDLIGPKR